MRRSPAADISDVPCLSFALNKQLSQAAQQSEVYWMALARDIPFSEYATNDITRTAAGRSGRKCVPPPTTKA